MGYLPLIFGDGANTAAKAAVAFCEWMQMRTNVYIDGFNLFYGALKGSTHKWLDVRRLSETLFPNDQIKDIYYFTSRLRTVGGNGGRRQRQDFYLRAIETLPGVKIVYGTHRPRGNSWEEKKTDVNLATTMVFDAFMGEYEQAIVITNDSDIVNPIQRVRDDLGLQVVVVNPRKHQKTHHELRAAATAVLRIKEEHLAASQLPTKIQDASGRWIAKPASW